MKPKHRGGDVVKKGVEKASSEQLYRKLFDNQATGMCVFDVRGKFLQANAKFKDLLGYPKSRALTETAWKNLIPGTWKTRKPLAWKKVREGESFIAHEVVAQGKKGKGVTLLVNGTVLDKGAAGNPLVLLTVMDVTERRKHEAKSGAATEKLTARIKLLEKKLAQGKEELEAARAESARSTRSVRRLNDAMKVLLTQLQEEKKDLEERITNNFRLTVEPIVEHLRAGNLPDVQRHLLDTLDFGLRNITSYFGINISRYGSNLSPREVQICQMVREGKDSRAIAEAMGLAYQTVIVHRKNIRRKLGLKKQKKNLATYLQQM
jgi:PAS domain S-box-containing protein